MCTGVFPTCRGKEGADYEAGIVILQSETHSLRLVRYTDGNTDEIRAVLREKNEETVVGCIPAPEGKALNMRIEIRSLTARLTVNSQLVAEGVDVDCLSTEKADGFVGNTAGIYVRSGRSFAEHGEDAPYIECAAFSV